MNPNPCERWFEWKGKTGTVCYYDKEKKENITVKQPFTFIVLNQMATIRGYNKAMKSGIYSNEVRNVSDSPLLVKTYAGDKIAEGFYAAIKDTIVAKKGHYCTNCYIAFKDADLMRIGCIQFQGCSLGPWIDFVKPNKKALYSKAVTIKQGVKDVSGDVEFVPPMFSLLDIKKETDDVAGTLQEELKQYFDEYFARGTNTRAAAAASNMPPNDDEPPIDEPTMSEPPEDSPF
jgi:hypothetical protein